MLRSLSALFGGNGLAVAGLIFLLEGIGTPIPVEAPLGILGYRLAHGTLSLVAAVLLMWVTTNVGNLIGYGLGYWGGRPLILRLIRLLRIKPESWDRMERWFHKNGLRAVVITRWINWGFAQNMWLCGITRIPLRRFLPVMLINNLLWAIGWSWLSSILLAFFRRRGFWMLRGLVDHLPWVLLGALTVGGLGWYLWRRFRRETQTDH